MNRKRWIHRGATIGPGCWEWKGHKERGGYGASGDALAHRQSFLRFIGDIPSGMIVMHRCDNPPCVRPSHLSIGTQGENLKDMDRKGRRRPPRGSQNAASVLTENDVVDIRTLRAAGATNRVLADAFNVTITNIQTIQRRTSWRHVP